MIIIVNYLDGLKIWQWMLSADWRIVSKTLTSQVVQWLRMCGISWYRVAYSFKIALLWMVWCLALVPLSHFLSLFLSLTLSLSLFHALASSCLGSSIFPFFLELSLFSLSPFLTTSLFLLSQPLSLFLLFLDFSPLPLSLSPSPFFPCLATSVDTTNIFLCRFLALILSISLSQNILLEYLLL